MTPTYDVFLSHNSADKAAVELVALRLRNEAKLRPFLDKWALVPGDNWIPRLEQAIEVTFADRCITWIQRMGNRATHAVALLQAGRWDEARRRFEEAEAIQAKQQPLYPRLFSLQGFRYCDLLLCKAEHESWRVMVTHGDGSSSAAFLGDDGSSTPNDAKAYGRALAACDEVLGRAAEAMTVATQNNWLLDIALDHISLGRASLYRTLLAAFAHPEARRPASPTNLMTAEMHIHAAVEGLRHSGHRDYLPRGLLTRAWLHHLLTNPIAATDDLDEVESLATRCGMPIFLADAYLTRARLFRDRTALTKARDLLLDLRTRGYHRHDLLLDDAEQASTQWPAPS